MSTSRTRRRKSNESIDVRLTIALSRCRRESGDLAAAIEVARDGLSQLETDGAPVDDQYIELAATLVGAYNERGDYVLARRLAETTIEAADLIGSPLARGSAYWNAMLVAVNTGRMTDAERYADRALALYGETSGERNLARLKVAYSWLLLRLDSPRPEQVLTMLSSAAHVMNQSGSVVDNAYLHTERARALLMLSRVDEAEEAAREARELLDRTDVLNPVEAARVTAVTAQVELVKGNNAAAVELIDSAARSMHDVGASRAAGEVWREIGEIAFTMGQSDVGQQAFRQALDGVGIPCPPSLSEVSIHSRPPQPSPQAR